MVEKSNLRVPVMGRKNGENEAGGEGDVEAQKSECEKIERDHGKGAEYGREPHEGSFGGIDPPHGVEGERDPGRDSIEERRPDRDRPARKIDIRVEPQ